MCKALPRPFEGKSPYAYQFGAGVRQPCEAHAGVVRQNAETTVHITQQFVRYAAVGAIGTLVHYGVLVVLVQSQAAGALIASTIGFGAGALVNYLLNYYLTFRSRERHHEALAKFMTVALLGLAVNAAVMALLAGALGLHYLLAQLVATAVVLAAGFLANRWWTFGRHSGA